MKSANPGHAKAADIILQNPKCIFLYQTTKKNTINTHMVLLIDDARCFLTNWKNVFDSFQTEWHNHFQIDSTTIYSEKGKKYI